MSDNWKEEELKAGLLLVLPTLTVVAGYEEEVLIESVNEDGVCEFVVVTRPIAAADAGL